MSKLLISILIGLLAGIIDVVPMLVQKLDKFACASAFVHWIIMGVIISYINLPLPPWLKGLVVAELSAIPVIILVAKEDPLAIIPIVIMSAILGVAVGISTAKFA